MTSSCPQKQAPFRRLEDRRQTSPEFLRFSFFVTPSIIPASLFLAHLCLTSLVPPEAVSSSHPSPHFLLFASLRCEQQSGGIRSTLRRTPPLSYWILPKKRQLKLSQTLFVWLSSTLSKQKIAVLGYDATKWLRQA